MVSEVRRCEVKCVVMCELWCGLVWCDLVCCDLVWCGVVWHSKVWCEVVRGEVCCDVRVVVWFSVV